MFDKHRARTSEIIQSHCSFFASTLYNTNCGLKSKYGATKMQNSYLDFLVQALFHDVNLYFNNDPKVNLGSFFKELEKLRKASEIFFSQNFICEQW